MLVFILTLALGLHLNFKPAAKTVTLKADAEKLLKQATHLMDVSSAYKYGRTPLDSLQKALIETRLGYKKLEFALAWWYPDFSEEHFNGAPLLKARLFDLLPEVVPPEGLQVLDELVFSDNPEAEKVLIATLGRQFYTEYSSVYQDFTARTFGEDEFHLAARAQLIRVFTLGVTGFDTPGSINAINEAYVSLAGLLKYSRQLGTNPELDKQFSGALQFLKQNQDFDDFNRLEFLREYIDPLFLTLQKGDSDFQKYSSYTKGWNPRATSIFDENLLDAYYYTELKEKGDNKDLYTLGKTLFYDKNLSSNGNMSCANCHNPQLAFTDGLAKSPSFIEGETVQRNSPTLLNAVYGDRYFYDLRAFTLEQQAEHVIFNDLEFNTAYAEILQKLKDNKEYKVLFKKAFGKKEIGREEFAAALSSYVLSLKSFNSPFDKYVRKESKHLPEGAERGFNLFMGKAACGTCHFAPTFAGLVPPFYNKNESEILGVLTEPDDEELDKDLGRVENQILPEKAWIYERSFKTTTVRNIALTAPYFHNGAYETLDQVVDFYNKGGGDGFGLEVKNQTLPFDELSLTEQEMSDLIAFMQTLTDTVSYKK